MTNTTCWILPLDVAGSASRDAGGTIAPPTGDESCCPTEQADNDKVTAPTAATHELNFRFMMEITTNTSARAPGPVREAPGAWYAALAALSRSRACGRITTNKGELVNSSALQ